MRKLWIAAAPLLLLLGAPAERPRTFANPINIDYRFMVDLPSRREAADPAIVLFGDDYYLFASKSGGYWHSKDMVEWTFVTPTGLPMEAYAPAVMVLDHTLYYTACNIGLYKSGDPKGDKWELVSQTFSVGDPDLFADDDGRVYLYYGLSYNAPFQAWNSIRTTSSGPSASLFSASAPTTPGMAGSGAATTTWVPPPTTNFRKALGWKARG